MKFSCCANAYVPDWLMGELYTLATQSTATLESHCEKLQHFHHDLQKSDKDNSVIDESLKGPIIAVHYLLYNAARFQTTKDQLSFELQQLGLPKDHALCLANYYDSHRAEMIRTCHNDIMKSGYGIGKVTVTPARDDDSVFFKVTIRSDDDSKREISFFADRIQLSQLRDAISGQLETMKSLS